MPETIVDRVSQIAHNIDTNEVKLPQSIKIELSSICNHKCSYCIVPKLHLNQYFMDFNVLKVVVEEAKRLNITEMGLFHMGEGTLHPLFTNYIDYIQTTYPQCKLFITTNGTKEEPLLYAIKKGVNSIKISLNGYNNESHREITGVDTFGIIIDNLKKMVEYRNKINSPTQISASSIFYNNEEQDTFANQLDSIVDKHYYTQIYNHASKVNNQFINLNDNPKIIHNLCSLPCFGLYNLCHVKINGDINLCRFGIDDEFVVGNILSDTLDNIWFSKKANNIRHKSLNKMIETCNRCVGISNGL